MSNTLLAIAMAAAIGCVLAWWSTHIRNPARRNSRSVLGEIAAGCRDLSGAVCSPFEPSWTRGDEPPLREPGDREVRLWGLAAAVLGDARLLHERMTFMHIDRDEFACDEPAVMRQLTICCVRCGSTGECARDLSDTLTGLLGGQWRDYCPNAAMLNTISALRTVGIPFVPPAAVSSMTDGSTATVSR
jgi:hypothetical protein